MRDRLFGTFLLVVIAIGAPTLALDGQDEESRILSDKWYLSLGGSSTDFNTRGAVGFGSVVGTFIRLEEQLDLDSNQSNIRFNGVYQFNRKHSIDFTFGDSSRDGTSMIEDSIIVGDDGDEVEFMVGALVETAFDTSSAKIFYKYSFINNGKTQAGIGAGLSIFDYKLSLEGTGFVDDGSGGGPQQEFVRVSEDILAPVPSFNLFIHHAFMPKLIFRATAAFFDINAGDIDGGLIETRGTIDWFFNRRIGIGGGLERTDIDFADEGDDPLLVQVKTNSWIFYLSSTF
jgi:hypothetical protein